MPQKPLDELYFEWLYSQVGAETSNLAQSYWNLLRILFVKKFRWFVDFDGNRAADGIALRQHFLNENPHVHEEPGWMNEPCSMLEMMIALARDIAFEGEGTLAGRFWEMINNIGLIEGTDARVLDEAAIDGVLERVITRQYGFNGEGGFFPLTVNPRQEDQRIVELWYQANAYLLEQLEMA